MRVAGVDLGVRKVAMAVVGPGKFNLDAFESNATSRATQLREVAQWVASRVKGWNIDALYVEEPLVGRGTRISLQIAQTAGAVLAATEPVLNSDNGVTPSYLVSNTAWKKAVIGVGAGKDIKLKVRMWLDEHHSYYSECCDRDQDRYDACCIALYGQQQQLIASRLREGAHLSRA